MRKLGFVCCAMLLLGMAAQSASAANISLFEYAFNIDGSVYDVPFGSPFPGIVDLSGFNTSTGLGTVTITISSLGNHSVFGFFDNEIDESVNTFFNEYGSTSGSPASGQSWEIDEPGWGFSGAGYIGDIYTNLQNGSLDNQIMDGSFTGPEDISMAMGWGNFSLSATEIATIRFNLSTTAPTSAFYLMQTDPDSSGSVYLSSSLTINQQGTNPIPEPSTIVLLVSGLGLAAAMRFRKSR